MRMFIIVVVVSFASITFMAVRGDEATKVQGEVFKSPTCSCCSKWIAIVEDGGISLRISDGADLTSTKTKLRVPNNVWSCHTAVIDGYVFEGHVPIDLLQEVLTKRPRIVGLAVPGMPVGSPGMEIGGRKDHYMVVAFDREGKQTIYAER